MVGYLQDGKLDIVIPHDQVKIVVPGYRVTGYNFEAIHPKKEVNGLMGPRWKFGKTERHLTLVVAKTESTVSGELSLLDELSAQGVNPKINALMMHYAQLQAAYESAKVWPDTRERPYLKQSIGRNMANLRAEISASLAVSRLVTEAPVP